MPRFEGISRLVSRLAAIGLLAGGLSAATFAIPAPAQAQQAQRPDVVLVHDGWRHRPPPRHYYHRPPPRHWGPLRHYYQPPPHAYYRPPPHWYRPPPPPPPGVYFRF